MTGSVVVSDAGAKGVCRVTMNRPGVLNAFDHEMAEGLAVVLNEIRLDLSVRAVVLTGAGRGFCAGGDVAAMKASPNPATYIEELSRRLHQSLQAILRMPQVVIAAVNGPVAGGGLGLSLACDMRIAAESATFSAGHLKLGISPDGGPTFFLPRLAGDAAAAHLLLAGAKYTARDALARGLVIEVVPDVALDARAIALAAQIAKAPRTAVAQTKSLLRQTWSRSLETQLEEERSGLSTTGRTPSFKEGLAAFLEKRPPNFG